MQEKKLTFVEGASSKFWSATQDGELLTVQYGRLGTAGQTQVKTFASDTEAASAFAKQVAEKLKKGYVESGDATSQPPSPRPVGEPKKAPPVTVEPAVLDLNPPRQIRLTDADRKRADVRALPASNPRLPAEPFDMEQCSQRLLKIGKPEDYSYTWKWGRAKLPLEMSQEEAVFWWNTMLLASGNSLTLSQLHKKVGYQSQGGAQQQLSQKHYCAPDLTQLKTFHRSELLIPAFTLFGFAAILTIFDSANDWSRPAMLTDFEEQFLPNLSQEEHETLRNELSHRPTQELWVLRLLNQLHEHTGYLLPIVVKWVSGSGKPEYFGGYYGNQGNQYLRVLLGLRDPQTIALEARRLEALPTGADDIRLLLAATEFRCLDLITQSILAHTTKADAESLTKAFALAEAPEVAPHMLELMVESKAPGVARQWLDEHPVFATEGLLPIAAGQGKKADAALAYLRGLKKRELGYVIDAKLEGQPESIVNVIRERVLEREEVVYEPLTESEAPEWVKIVFGGELTVPDAPADENPERRLNITEADKASNTPPALPEYQPLPPAPPFDIDACLAKLNSVYDGSNWKLQKLDFALPMSLDEAHFWHAAFCRIEKSQGKIIFTPQVLETELRTHMADTNKQTAHRNHHFYPSWIVPIWVLFGVTGLLNMVRSQQASLFGKRILPYLSAEQRQGIAEKISEATKTQINHHSLIGLFQLMEQLIFSAEQFEEILLQQKRLASHWYSGRQYLPYLQRLKTPEAILAAANLLGAWPESEVEARKWLGATGWLGVSVLEKTLPHSYDKSEAAKIFALVEAPEVARHLVTLRKFPSSKVIARTWLDRFPAFVIEGLAPLLIEKDKKQVELAQDYLRELKRKGYAWLIEKKQAGFDDEIQAEVKKRVLDYDPRKDKAPLASDSALAMLLPPVVVKTESGLRRLTPPQQAMLIADLRTTPLAEPSPSLELVRQNAEKLALDAFVWALFESWQSDGAPSKERWKMEALGHLGSDSVALKLTPLIRLWPGESQHQRAVLGLDCLRAIGTDTALMQINGIAEKVSFKGIKERAKECMEAIATDRNFTRDELSDRIIPDGGLDARGSRRFDFGTRQFQFLLSAELKPMVRDEAGKRLPDLPKPNTKDDAEKATEAVAAWKLLKKQVAEIAKSQAVRLEQAMVIGRRWTLAEFHQLFIAHPVMIHLVRRLIWCAYDATNTPLAAFRVADDNTLADDTDTLWTLPETATHIGIVHPAHLTPAQQGAWGEVLADYEIIPPFTQLGRPTYDLSAEETQARKLTRFAGIKNIDPKVLLFGLDNLGWTRGAAQDGGWFTEHYKTFLSAGITAVVSYHGAPVGYLDGWEDQEVEEIYFTRDAREAAQGWISSDSLKSLIPIGDVPPVIVSEVLHDITRLVEKGKKV